MKLSQLSVAVIHDSIVEYGGAERVLQELIHIFPQSDVYTAYSDPRTVERVFNTQSRPSIRNALPISSILSRRSSLFQSAAALIWKKFNLEHYDVVLSCPSYLMCNLVNVRRPRHIQYIQSIPKNLVGFLPATRYQRTVPYTATALAWYKKALASTPFILANSNFVKQMLLSNFRVESSVIYPPVSFGASRAGTKKRNYFLCVSRLDEGKYVDIAIKTCTQHHVPLLIAGKANNTAYERYLRSISGPTIRFVGEKSHRDIQALFDGAIALIHSSKNEDFGMAPVEAIGSGVPVIAYYAGALVETVNQGRTGVFYYTHTPRALYQAMNKTKTMYFDSTLMRDAVEKFGRKRFKREIEQYVLSKSGSDA